MTPRRRFTTSRTDLADRIGPPRRSRALQPAAAGLALALVMLLPSPGGAWGATGHMTVCEIAYRQLSDAARSGVDEVFGGRPFPAQCTWPDMVRKTKEYAHTSPWHFINLEDGEDYFSPGTVSADGDVLQALLDAERTLASRDAAAHERVTALRFLGHLAGDSHQPLHAGRRSDLGGNRTAVRWFGKRRFKSSMMVKWDGDPEACEGGGRFVDAATGECVVEVVEKSRVNLHKVWDVLMIDRFVRQRRLRPEPGDSEHLHKAYASALAGTLPAAEVEAMRSSTFWDWIESALEGRGRAYDVGDGRLRGEYYRDHVDDLNRQIARAGYRLAFTLERLFGDRPPEAAAIEARHEELRRRLGNLVAAD